MVRIHLYLCRISLLLAVCATTLTLTAGIDKRLQSHYLERYLNKTFFLRIPMHGSLQVVEVKTTSRLDPLTQTDPLTFKVGEQVRVTGLEFKDRSIRFRVSSPDGSAEGMVFFRFYQPLEQYFEQQGDFEAALTFAFTEGVSYRDIDAAKISFIENQYKELINKFVASTGTSKEFVIQRIAEQNPRYRKAIQDLQELEARVTGLKMRMVEAGKELASEQTRSRNLEQQLEEITTELDEEKEEQLRILGQRDQARENTRRLQTQRDELKRAQETYERQVTHLVSSLDVEQRSGEEVGSKVESIESFVSQLQTARFNLSNQLAEVQGQVSTLQDENQKLRQELTSTESTNKRLSSRLRALTSDKKSINAQYLEMREQKEILERADAISRALRVESLLDPGAEEESLGGHFFLGSQLLGTLRIAPPEQVGNRTRVEIMLLSPDTVKFSDQERELHAALGDEVRAEAGWLAPEELSVELVESDGLRVLKRRENTFWDWVFEGEISSSQAATLKIDLIDRNDQKIPLYTQQFVVHPSGLGSWLSRFLSFPSLLLGLILGGAAIAGLSLLRRTDRKSLHGHPVEYLTDKKL